MRCSVTVHSTPVPMSRTFYRLYMARAIIHQSDFGVGVYDPGTRTGEMAKRINFEPGGLGERSNNSLTVRLRV